MQQQLWQFKDLKINGVSLAGIYSCYHMPDLNLCVDVGQGFDWVLNTHLFLITHGHMDHAAGIPYIISQKNMRHHPVPQFYMPGSLIKPMTDILKLWSTIENFDYDYQFFAVEDFKCIPLNTNFKIKPFKTTHRIDSFGYSVIRTHRTLLPAYKEKAGNELAELKKQGVMISQEKEVISVSFSGDSQIEFLDSYPELLNSEVLFLESTFIDSKKSIDDTRKWGHTHLFEILDRLPQIKSEKILLKHLSSRYSLARANQILDEFVPSKDRHRFEVFPGR